MHVILDDLRAEDRVGEYGVGVQYSAVQEQQEWEATVDGRRLRFDGDATDKTEYPEPTALSFFLAMAFTAPAVYTTA